MLLIDNFPKKRNISYKSNPSSATQHNPIRIEADYFIISYNAIGPRFAGKYFGYADLKIITHDLPFTDYFFNSAFFSARLACAIWMS